MTVSIRFLISHISLSATLVALLVHCVSSADAAQLNRPFNVTVNLQQVASLEPTSIFCRTSPALAFGAVLTVVCSTGEVVDVSANPKAIPFAPIHGITYRYVTHGSAGFINTEDEFSSLGTVTTWRMIDLVDRDYLEILVGW